MLDPTARSFRLQSDLYQAVIAPRRQRFGRKIASGGPSWPWRATEAETKPAVEPHLWRDWKLEPGELGAEQDRFHDSPGPEVETGPTVEPHLWRNWNLECWGAVAEQDGFDDFLDLAGP